READQIIDTMMAQNKDVDDAYLAKADYYRAYKPQQIDEVRADLAKVVDKLAPGNPKVLLVAADLELGRQPPDQKAARQLLERGLTLPSHDYRFYQRLARLDLQQGKLDAASEHLKQGLKVLPNRPSDIWEFADLFIDAGQLTEAQPLIERLQK